MPSFFPPLPSSPSPSLVCTVCPPNSLLLTSSSYEPITRIRSTPSSPVAETVPRSHQPHSFNDRPYLLQKSPRRHRTAQCPWVLPQRVGGQLGRVKGRWATPLLGSEALRSAASHRWPAARRPPSITMDDSGDAPSPGSAWSVTHQAFDRGTLSHTRTCSMPARLQSVGTES